MRQTLWGAEPVAIAAVIRSLLVVLVVFGVDLTDEQIAALLLLTEAVLAVVTRARVTPVQAKP